jgi:hypothetical protein
MGNAFFCQIAAAYFSGLTNGTTATTFSPTQNVTREQMAAFTTRTLDQSLKRGSKRAALNQWWTTIPQYDFGLGTTSVGDTARLVQSDGIDIWVANLSSDTVSRVRASDGKLIETWTGATAAYGVLSAMNRIFVTGARNPGYLYMIDPSQPAGTVTTVASELFYRPSAMAFDGARIWIANYDAPTVTIVTPGATLPWVTEILPIEQARAHGLVYDGANMWGTEPLNGWLHKLGTNGGILQSVRMPGHPYHPIFDGTNIWVPCQGTTDSIAVVRASTGALIATLTGNGLNYPYAAAFDGERILVTNFGDSVSLWKATDLTPLGSFSTGFASFPYGVCSDGLNFWIALSGTKKLARL